MRCRVIDLSTGNHNDNAERNHPSRDVSAVHAIGFGGLCMFAVCVAMIVAMGAATVFYFKHSDVDQQTMLGQTSIILRDSAEVIEDREAEMTGEPDTETSEEADEVADSEADADEAERVSRTKEVLVFSIEASDDMQACINYRGLELRGKLKLYGGDAETAVYILRNIAPVDESTPEDVKLAMGSTDGTLDSTYIRVSIRVPKSGLTGDHIGRWALDYSYGPSSLELGDWCVLYEDGSALMGSNRGEDVVNTLSAELEAMSSPCTWEQRGDDIVLEGN